MANALRVLLAGWVSSPHVLAWAEAVEEAGNDVYVAGRAPPEWPPPRANVKVYTLPFEGPLVLRSLKLSRALADVAAEVKPDLVHAHWLPEYGWMAAREGIRPLVCSAWGSDVLRVRGIGRQRSKRALDAAALVFVDSIHLARATSELADRDVPIEIVRWGLDFQRFAPGDQTTAREALRLEQEGPLVVSVRGFMPVYNPELQLEAFARVRTLWPEARLLLKHPAAGVPRSISASIERLGLENAVTILANVPPERMPDIYRAADVVLSVPSSDSSPRSVWEAFACARPVIVSDLPWARDELTDGRHALLVPLDADAIATAIGRVLSDRALGGRLGVEARALTVDELDPQACSARIDKLYRSVVEA
jgi:L-malate glycosyltransferase